MASTKKRYDFNGEGLGSDNETLQEVKISDIKTGTQIRNTRTGHYSQNHDVGIVKILNPLYPLYYKGAYTLAVLLSIIIVLTYGQIIPVEMSIPLFGVFSIFLLTFIGEIRNKKYVKIGS